MSQQSNANLLAVTGLLITAVQQAAQLGALIQAARAQGRDVTDEELEALRTQDDAARAQLQSAINAAAPVNGGTLSPNV
jgi:hypothetical protein